MYDMSFLLSLLVPTRAGWPSILSRPCLRKLTSVRDRCVPEDTVVSCADRVQEERSVVRLWSVVVTFFKSSSERYTQDAFEGPLPAVPIIAVHPAAQDGSSWRRWISPLPATKDKWESPCPMVRNGPTGPPARDSCFEPERLRASVLWQAIRRAMQHHNEGKIGARALHMSCLLLVIEGVATAISTNRRQLWVAGILELEPLAPSQSAIQSACSYNLCWWDKLTRRY